MDAGGLPLGTKSLKVLGGVDASQSKDAISRLPDEVLLHILSFLPTEEAIKTSVLSKKWRYMWVSVPNFSFVDFSFIWSKTESPDQILELGASFVRSIERVLLLRNASCLGNFCLWLNMHISPTRFHSWLSAAVEHKVQKLDLCLPDQWDFTLPDSLFISKSLSSFGFQVHWTFKVPSFTCFSGLKELKLHDVVFQDDQSVQQLFFGCPLLEDLSLHDCCWENITKITIGISTLRSLTFSDSYFWDDRFFNCKIIISALNLEILDVSSFLPVELVPQNLPSLNFASIDIKNWTGREEHGHRVVKLLYGLHNVKFLKLSSETLEPLHFAEDLKGHLPTYYNLTKLSGFVKFPLSFPDYTIGALVYILQLSPNLETLDLLRVFKPQEQGMVLEGVPHCFKSRLKCFTVYIDDENVEDDICFLKHVFKTTPILKRLVINCSQQFSKDLERQEEIRGQLQRLHGGLSSCSIEFIPHEW